MENVFFFKRTVVVLSFFVVQVICASEYAMRMVIDIPDPLTYSSSIVWIDGSKNNKKILAIMCEQKDEHSHDCYFCIKILDETLYVRYGFLMPKGIEVKRAIFNPDDRYIHAIRSGRYGNEEIVTLHNKLSDFGEKSIKAPEVLCCLAISPDGQLLVVGGEKGYLKFLDPFSLEAAPGDEISEEDKAFHGITTALSFNKSGNKIISAHQLHHSSLIKIFDRDTKDCNYILENNGYWQRNNIRSICFNSVDENLIHFTIANKLYTAQKDKLEEIFFHKIHSDYIATNKEGEMMLVNKRGQLRKIVPSNVYKPKLSEETIKANKHVPFISFVDEHNLNTVIGASDINQYSKGPVLFMYKEVPPFREIMKRQITGSLFVNRTRK